MNIETDSASNLEEAKVLSAEREYAVFLTDKQMVSGMGFDLVRYVNELLLTMQVKIFLSDARKTRSIWLGVQQQNFNRM